MPLKTEAMEEPDLNLTPMIDIVLLLIIFFMVGTRFSEAERQFTIELPTVTDAQPLTSLPDEITVAVDKEGAFYLNDEKITLDDLDVELQKAQKNYADQAVIIRGDGQGTYQFIMDVLASCHRADIKNIKLANRVKSKDAP